MAHGDAQEGKWRGKMQMEWVASSLALYVGTRSTKSLSADPHSSTASSRLNWHPCGFKWTNPFQWKTKSGFCACAITFRTCYTAVGSVYASFATFRILPLINVTLSKPHKPWKKYCHISVDRQRAPSTNDPPTSGSEQSSVGKSNLQSRTLLDYHWSPLLGHIWMRWNSTH